MPFSDFHFRPLDSGDAAGLYKLVQQNNARLKKYFPLTLEAVNSPSAAKRYVRENLEKMKEGTGYYFLVDYLPEQRPVALLILKDINLRIPKAELAYFVDGSFEGRGLTTWAVGHLVHFAFNQLGFHKLFLLADEQNHGSCRVAEKNGFGCEGVLMDDYRTGVGDLINSRYYGLLKSKWESCRNEIL
ncbi:MAG: GNAT family N-acetyltransferase [Flavobacteriaceae bacterium]|nr:GNAT family N-acetyltransferase [Flavobacteriaceae bacterium]MCB0705784.1 GNAT family N-acetyltransferase [Saprospiraceae bacterium]